MYPSLLGLTSAPRIPSLSNSVSLALAWLKFLVWPEFLRLQLSLSGAAHTFRFADVVKLPSHQSVLLVWCSLTLLSLLPVQPN